MSRKTDIIYYLRMYENTNLDMYLYSLLRVLEPPIRKNEIDTNKVKNKNK